MSDLISRDKLNECIKYWYEHMGVDIHGVWNKQLAEIVKGMDEDDLALEFRFLRESIRAIPSAETTGALDDAIAKYVADGLMELPSAEATKKKADLKENGDWDCPDVGCDECDHHRGVEWCSLAIPNHEEIDEIYKMVNEAFFDGFNAAEKQYRLLIETVEELDKELAEAVQGEWIEDEKDWQHCSVCGVSTHIPSVYMVKASEDSNLKYCPHCGAKMTKGGEQNDD